MQTTSLAQLRAKGYSLGLFPSIATYVSRNRKAMAFRLAMGRVVTFNLISRAWFERSPDGEMRGKLAPIGAARLTKRA